MAAYGDSLHNVQFFMITIFLPWDSPNTKSHRIHSGEQLNKFIWLRLNIKVFSPTFIWLAFYAGWQFLPCASLLNKYRKARNLVFYVLPNWFANKIQKKRINMTFGFDMARFVMRLSEDPSKLHKRHFSVKIEIQIYSRITGLISRLETNHYF